MCPGCCVDKLPCNADPIGRFPDTAFEQVAHAQLTAHLPNVDGLALVSEARIARDYKQPPDTRQSSNDVLDHAVSKVFLLGIAAQVGESEDGDRGIVRKREHGSERLDRCPRI